MKRTIRQRYRVYPTATQEQYFPALLGRDYNAAVNIMLAGGTTESLNACGEYVRALALVQPPDLNEAGTHQVTAHAV